MVIIFYRIPTGSIYYIKPGMEFLRICEAWKKKKKIVQELWNSIYGLAVQIARETRCFRSNSHNSAVKNRRDIQKVGSRSLRFSL